MTDEKWLVAFVTARHNWAVIVRTSESVVLFIKTKFIGP